MAIRYQVKTRDNNVVGLTVFGDLFVSYVLKPNGEIVFCDHSNYIFGIRSRACLKGIDKDSGTLAGQVLGIDVVSAKSVFRKRRIIPKYIEEKPTDRLAFDWIGG